LCGFCPKIEGIDRVNGFIELQTIMNNHARHFVRNRCAAIHRPLPFLARGPGGDIQSAELEVHGRRDASIMLIVML